MKLCLASLAAAILLFAGPAQADPWKDESGKGWKRGENYGWQQEHRSRRGREVRIPKGDLPPPGECRVWTRGVPAGHQAPPYKC